MLFDSSTTWEKESGFSPNYKPYKARGAGRIWEGSISKMVKIGGEQEIKEDGACEVLIEKKKINH